VSHLREHVEVRDIARHIRRMALLVRGAVSQGVPKARAKDGCSSAGCSATGCSATGCAKDDCAGDAGRGAEGGQCVTGPGWWVLAQGGPLDESDFEARERAREELLARVRQAGILVGENVWVWDLSGRAQLVLTTLPTLERARKVAKRLREKGLAIVVRREMGEAPGCR
jgi:hypothetical protein